MTTQTNPERLLDRVWRGPGWSRPRVSRRRQVLMLLLLMVLATVIAAYGYVTDSRRVRRMAEAYLSELVGGRVQIRQARLSIFEGLRLDGVSVRVEEQTAADSEIFSAQTLLVQYNLHALLNGRLEATRIGAIDPRVRLCENLSDGSSEWNFQRLRHRGAAPDPSRAADGPPLALPEIVLRGGQVDYARRLNGRYQALGSMAIEGQLVPSEQPDHYRFEIESRGIGQTTGPSIRGSLDMRDLEVVAQLRGFDFAGAIRNILPAPAQRFLEDHQLSGRIDIPTFYYLPGRNGKPAAFRLEVDLDRVNLCVHPREFVGPQAHRQRRLALDFYRNLQQAGLEVRQHIADIEADDDQQPIKLAWVTGRFVFTRNAQGDSIELRDVAGWIEKNSFVVRGRIHGFEPSAPAELTLLCNEIFIPEHPHYLTALPPKARELYQLFRPTGTARLQMSLNRQGPEAMVLAAGQVEILDCRFLYQGFAYPLHHTRGKILFGHDPQTHKDWARIENLTGQGPENSANARGTFTINGLISPLDETNAIRVQVHARNINLDTDLMNALEPPTRQTLRQFAPTSQPHPRLFGDVLVKVDRPEGPIPRYRYDVDLSVKDGAGAYSGFAYPLENVQAEIRIGPEAIEVLQATAKRQGGQLTLSGRVATPEGGKSDPDLRVKATNIPIDQELLAAIPEAERKWLVRGGLTGRLDVEGRLTAPPAQSPGSGDFGYDLRLALREGALWPIDGSPALTAATASGHLSPQRLHIEQFEARRGEGTLRGSGTVTATPQGAHIALAAEATQISLDSVLYRMLPADARAAWDSVQPQGSLDASLRYTAGAHKDADYSVELRPRKLSATYREVPYRLDELSGTVLVTPAKVTLTDIVGKHGKAQVRLQGAGSGSNWDLSFVASHLKVDDDLRKALPTSLAELAQATSLQGALSLECSRLSYKGEAPTTSPATRPSTTAPASGKIDFQVRVGLVDAAMELGIPLSSVHAVLDLTGQTSNGTLGELAGKVDVASALLAGRPARNLRCDLLKPRDRQAMQLSRLDGQLAGGQLAGQIEVAWPDRGPGRYALAVVLNGADARLLSNETDKGPQGRISASLSLEGDWGAAGSRRGRGDVLVNGRDMYRIPLVLGLLHVTNLALPISSPYNQATARYTVEGQRVAFDRIELQAGNMLMQGMGSLDYETRRVKLTFTTAAAAGWKIPLLEPLLAGARQELLQIHVNGTIQEPQVAARSFNTFTTTVDEVFRGNQAPPNGPRKNKP